MTLTWIDYLIIGLYFAVTVSIGFWFRRQAGVAVLTIFSWLVVTYLRRQNLRQRWIGFMRKFAQEARAGNPLPRETRPLRSTKI